MHNSAAIYRARLRAKAKLEKADRWLDYLEGQLTLARAAKAEALEELRGFGMLPDPDLTNLLDDL